LQPVKKGFSATQLIEQLCFKQNSLLFKEFDNLFSSLFDEADVYIELLRIIAGKKSGTSQKEIIERSKHLSKGGSAVKKLTELEEAGFIIGFKPHLHKRRGVYYRLIDEYTLFYLDWIEPVRSTLQKNSLESGYWEVLQNSGSWNAWAGYAFEAICYKHISQIRKKLLISPTAIADGWRYSPQAKSNEDGAQVDLLFDRDDGVITLCEIKYTDKPYVLNKEEAKKLQTKINVFVKATRTKKQIFLVMISANDIAKTDYTVDMVHGVVTLEDLFA
jgi:hypothetical protein